jgi:hypothetical protein
LQVKQSLQGAIVKLSEHAQQRKRSKTLEKPGFFPAAPQHYSVDEQKSD